MPPIIDYILKASICLAVTYVFYQLFLRRLTFYNWNRCYLLGYTALSFVIPFINIMPELQKQQLDESTVLQWIPTIGYQATTQQSFIESLSYWDWALAFTFLGIIISLLRFAIKLFSFLRMKQKAMLLTKDNVLLYHLNENITPFSFGNAIFINKHLHKEEDLEEIIRHEFVHVKQKHTIDIIFCELLCIINWFNPFAWLLRHSMKQNLEFIADDKVVQNGFDKKEYQYLLLKVMGNQQFAFTNHFNFSSLKKRIVMMNTIKTAKVHLVKFLFLLPVVAVLLLSFRKEVIKDAATANTANIADTIPVNDTGYKIMVFSVPNGGTNSYMNKKIMEKISIEDWNKNKEFYEKKYGKAAVKATPTEENEKKVSGDSVYVMHYNPKPFNPNQLIILDGKEITKAEMDKINPKEIKSISVLKDKTATELYGEKGKEGVIIIDTKKEKQGAIDDKKGVVVVERHLLNKDTATPSKSELKSVIVTGFYLDPKENDSLISKRAKSQPLFIADGKEIDDMNKINTDNIQSVTVLKDNLATDKYGDKGKNGVILITTKDGKVNLKNKDVKIVADSIIFKPASKN
ncbi:MAG: M56 family metallopeptidase [Niabella sp.]